MEIAGRVFDVRVKSAKDGSGRIVRVKPEFEDIRMIAETVSIPVREVLNLVMREVEQAEDKKD